MDPTAIPISFAQYFLCVGEQPDPAEPTFAASPYGCFGANEFIESDMKSPDLGLCENPLDEELDLRADHVAEEYQGVQQVLENPIGTLSESIHVPDVVCWACFHSDAPTGLRYGGSITINIIVSGGGQRPANRCNIDATLKGVQLMADYFHLTGKVGACNLNSGYAAPCCDSRAIIDDFAAWAPPSVQNPATGNFAFLWVEESNHNGQQANGLETPAYGAEYTRHGFDWSHRAIAQHEISRMFGAIDEGTWGWQGKGIMNEYHAWRGKTHYDLSCTPMYQFLWQTTQKCT